MYICCVLDSDSDSWSSDRCAGEQIPGIAELHLRSHGRGQYTYTTQETS